MLRKVITIQDLTLCLDKMDASGKIEIYQVFLRYNFTYILRNLENMRTCHIEIMPCDLNNLNIN